MAALVTSFSSWLINNSISVLIGSFITFGVITLIYLIQSWSLRRTVQRYHRLLATVGEQGVEQLLLDQVDTVRSAKETVASFQGRLSHLELTQQSHLQRVGVVRFNAFAETGSDLSFSVALLDHQDNGVVISSIHGRDEARTYAKPVVHGRSTYPLSREELLAIEKAAKSSSADDNEGKRTRKSE